MTGEVVVVWFIVCVCCVIVCVCCKGEFTFIFVKWIFGPDLKDNFNIKGVPKETVDELSAL